MNTFEVYWYPPGSSAPTATLTVQADDFAYDGDFVFFYTGTSVKGSRVLLVPRELAPVVTRVSAA